MNYGPVGDRGVAHLDETKIGLTRMGREISWTFRQQPRGCIRTVAIQGLLGGNNVFPTTPCDAINFISVRFENPLNDFSPTTPSLFGLGEVRIGQQIGRG
jgi:hypothetical protein